MALVSRLFRASFPATLLRSGALALLVQPSPARAEVVTLVCQDEKINQSFALRVDYDQKIVALLGSDGTTAYRSAPATISEGSVTWWGPVRGYKGEIVVGDPSNPWFDGSLNRLSGRGSAFFYQYESGSARSRSFAGSCRRATQKF